MAQGKNLWERIFCVVGVWLSIAVFLLPESTKTILQPVIKFVLATLTAWGLTGCLAFAAADTIGATKDSSYRYGRFEVEVVGDKQIVVGGEFVPSRYLPEGVTSTVAHLIVIDYTTKELSYYQKLASGGYEPMIGFAVVTPLATSLPSAVVKGRVYRIVEKPNWCPKVGGTVRRDDPTLPKGCLPYGHLQNSMGDWRFDINWSVKGWESVKVHGTTGYPRGSFWLEDTHGCTRLENRAIKRIVDLLGPSAVKEGIEVILQKGNPLLLHAL